MVSAVDCHRGGGTSKGGEGSDVETQNARPGVSLDVAEPAPQRVDITVRGELDVLSNQRLRDAFGGLYGRSSLQVAVDLTDARLRDNSSLATLIAARRRLCARGGSLALRGLTPPARRVIARTGLARTFLIEAV